jgi:hypothetical protein
VFLERNCCSTLGGGSRLTMVRSRPAICKPPFLAPRRRSISVVGICRATGPPAVAMASGQPNLNLIRAEISPNADEWAAYLVFNGVLCGVLGREHERQLIGALSVIQHGVLQLQRQRTRVTLVLGREQAPILGTTRGAASSARQPHRT